MAERKTAAKSADTEDSESEKKSAAEKTADRKVERAQKQAVAEIKEIHDKRDAFDNPPADPPVLGVDAVGETVGVDEEGPRLVFALEGQAMRVSIVGGNSVLLDGEGVRSGLRHFSKASASF